MGIDLIAAIVSLGVSFVALWRAYQPTIALRTLTKAFQDLEGEWDDQRASINSTLGRISRLKRDIMPAPVQREEAGDTETAPAVGANGLTSKQQTIQDQILARRQHGLLRR